MAAGAGSVVAPLPEAREVGCGIGGVLSSATGGGPPFSGLPLPDREAGGAEVSPASDVCAPRPAPALAREMATGSGRAPARLSVVGLGPGDPRLLAPLAAETLARTRTLAGYKAYLEMVPPELKQGKRLLATGMMGEVERCSLAVEAALAGEETAVVCGGDPGVYAMAGLVLEIVESRGLLDTLPLEVVPGIPAVTAAAALLGAPLTHDFACVSLSDLLTPWELIEKRLDAAAGADFVLALYNPRSKRRSGLLARALAIVARHRAPQTPVGFVRQAWREGQRVWTQPLAQADPEAADMLTIVLVGNSQTRLAGGRMLTPRGYAEKYAL